MAIVIVGMLDEREAVLSLIKEQIEQRNHKTILMDIIIGTGAIVSSLKPDVTGSDLATLAGRTIEEIKGMPTKERETATSLMAEGLTKKVIELYTKGELQGILHCRNDRNVSLFDGDEGVALWSAEALDLECGRHAGLCQSICRTFWPERYHGHAHRGRYRRSQPSGENAGH